MYGNSIRIYKILTQLDRNENFEAKRSNINKTKLIIKGKKIERAV